MHTLANWRSEDLSTSSKTSRNIPHSCPMGIVDRRGNDKDNTLLQNCKKIILGPSATRKASHLPRDQAPDIYHEFDTSDTDDCESVGSNSPALEVAMETIEKLKSSHYDRATSKSPIPANMASTQENLCGNTTKKVAQLTSQKCEDGGNHRIKSAIPDFNKNSSNKSIACEKKLALSNNTCKVKLSKDLQVDEIGNHVPGITRQKLKKSSASRNTSCHSSRKVLDNSTGVQQNNKFNDMPNDHVHFEEGNGGGPIITTNQPNTSKPNKNNVPNSQHQCIDDQEFSDEGDGGGYNSTNYVPSRKGRQWKHRSPSGERSERSKKGSRGESKRSTSGGSRSGSEENRQRQSRSRSRGSSSRSSQGSQGSRRHSSRHKKIHRRKKKHYPSRSQSSQSDGDSWIDTDGLSALVGHKPYPANWRCFGRRPPAIHEFRPLGEVRLKNVRPAGKLQYLMRTADVNRGCRGPDASDAWDNCYGLAKPLTSQWSHPLPYGTRVIRAGDIDPYFCPSRGDLVIINPAQNFYRAVKSGYVITYRGRGYSFGVGDLIVHLGRFMPNGEYIPYGNLELYMHTQTREMRLLGRQPFLLVDFNYHNLDYESPGKHLAIGTFLNETFFPRRGDIIIRGGAWAENYPNLQRKHHSSVKYWRPRMEFLPNDIMLRPYVDIGGKSDRSGKKFYWGAAELYTYSGKGLAWAYWGRDDHIFDTPYPRELEHGIKTGHHKDEVGHYGDDLQQPYGGRYDHGHGANDGCHSEHDHFEHNDQHCLLGHQGNDDCHSEHDLSHHSHH